MARRVIRNVCRIRHGRDILVEWGAGADGDRLLALNGVSLVFAVAANVLLLLNFAQRVRYRVAQPITVCFWWVSLVFSAGCRAPILQC